MSAKTSGSGRGFGVGGCGPTPAALFFRVSVSTAAKVSALDSDGDMLDSPAAEQDSPLLLRNESEEGERDRRGRGIGTGGLLASAPAGKSMTRSGVWPDVLCCCCWG